MLPACIAAGQYLCTKWCLCLKVFLGTGGPPRPRARDQPGQTGRQQSVVSQRVGPDEAHALSRVSILSSSILDHPTVHCWGWLQKLMAQRLTTFFPYWIPSGCTLRCLNILCLLKWQAIFFVYRDMEEKTAPMGCATIGVVKSIDGNICKVEEKYICK